MKKIVFVSPMHFGSEHVSFEVSIIQLYLKLYPESQFCYLGEDSHAKHIFSYFEKNTPFSFKTIKTKNRNLILWYTFLQVFFTTRKDSKIIYLALDPFYIYFLLVFLKIEVGFMHKYYLELRHWYGRLLNFIFLKCFLFLNKKIKFIVLGEWIYKGIQQDTFLSSREKKQFFWIDHPYFLPVSTKPVLISEKISFGFIGRQKTATYKKNNHSDLDSIQSTILSLGGLILSTGESFSSYEYYINTIIDSDYIIFLAPKNAYQFRCSGVFIESIVYGKKIICLDNSLTNYFFSKYTTLGYKCHSFNELEVLVRNILKKRNRSLRRNDSSTEVAKNFTDIELFIKKFGKVIRFV